MSNSKLVDVVIYSPNCNVPRNNKIDRITPHCVVGQCTVEALGELFANPGRQASSNYGIGYDGRVGLYVDEANRAWTSSSPDNDNRAITIEVASDTYAPYAMNDVAYKKLITLCVDICKRNGKTKLIWISDRNKALAYQPKSDEMLLTVHRWFAGTICPGDWLMARMGNLAASVTDALNPAQVTVDGVWGKNTTKLAQRVYKCKTISGNIKHQKKLYKKVCKACTPTGQANGSWYFTDSATGTEGYSPLIVKIQKELGIKYKKTSHGYGRMTKTTRKLLQKKLGVKVDGVIGSNTVKAFQKYINKRAKELKLK